MPHTLRRKMFKLGGEVNTHGVGITSGLSYNRPGYKKGGEVTTPIGVGSGNQPMVPGPDGKMREAHQLPLVGAAGNALLRSLLGGLGSLTGGYGKRFVPEWLKRYVGGEGIKKYVTRPKTYGISRGGIHSRHAIPPSTSKMFRRGAQLAFPLYGSAALGAGMGLSDRFGLTEKGNNDRLFETLARELGAFGLGASPVNLASRAGQALFGDPTVPDKNLYAMLAGETKPKVTADDTKGSVAEGIETQEEEFAALREDAEKRAQLYMELMGEEPDKIGAISRGLIQAGQLWDEDKGAAIGAIGTEAGAETQRVRDLEKGLRGMAVEEVVGGDLAQQQALETAKINLISNPDLSPEMRSQGLKGIEAYENGVKDILPLNANQDAAEGSKLSVGSVYYDPTNVYGGMYVAVSNNKNDPDGQVQGFDDVEEARAHARE